MPNLFVIPAQAGTHGNAKLTLCPFPRTAPARWRRSVSWGLTRYGSNTERLLQRVKIPDMCRAEDARPIPGNRKFESERTEINLPTPTSPFPRTAPARWRRSGSGVLTHRGLNSERLFRPVKIPDMRRAADARPIPGNRKFGDVRRGSFVQSLLVSLALLLYGLLLSIFGAAPAHAQSCTIDAQCSSGGRSVAMCVGDMLMVKSARCIGGSCQERKERRQNCGPGASQTISCQGSIAVRSGGGCDPIGQTCSARTDRDVCVKSCACVKNRLIVATGQCQNGCTCSGESRCV
jgi:hypothetical protein